MDSDVEMQDCAPVPDSGFRDLVLADESLGGLPSYEIVEQVSQPMQEFTITIAYTALRNTIHRARLLVFALAPTSLLEWVLDRIGRRNVRLHGMARILDEALANFSKVVENSCSFGVPDQGFSIGLVRHLEKGLMKSTRLQRSTMRAKRDISRVDEAFKLDINHKLRSSLLSPDKEVPYLEISTSLCRFGEQVTIIGNKSRSALQTACDEIIDTSLWQEAVRLDGVIQTLYEQARDIRSRAFYEAVQPLDHWSYDVFSERNGAVNLINFLEQWISSNAVARNATTSDSNR